MPTTADLLETLQHMPGLEDALQQSGVAIPLATSLACSLGGCAQLVPRNQLAGHLRGHHGNLAEAMAGIRHRFVFTGGFGDMAGLVRTYTRQLVPANQIRFTGCNACNDHSLNFRDDAELVQHVIEAGHLSWGDLITQLTGAPTSEHPNAMGGTGPKPPKGPGGDGFGPGGLGGGVMSGGGLMSGSSGLAY